MKALYELIISRLDLVPEIRWVDKKGAQDEKALKYPGVLVSFTSQHKDISESGDQEQLVTATITAIFDGTGLRSSSGVSDTTFNRSQEYERICWDIFEKLQGHSNEEFEILSCKSMSDDNRSDGLISKTMIFETSTYWQKE